METETFKTSIQYWLRLKRKSVPVESLPKRSGPAELFNVDQLERHAVSLAMSHQLAKKSTPDILLGRLSLSETILINSCNLLAGSTTEGFSPAREWLLDNFYLIQEQIHAIKRHLPKAYGRTLPQLAGAIPGYPRVYAIALAIIEHSDGRWDLEQLSRFINAYQKVTYLTLGELWAIPITLSVALIEHLSSVSQLIVVDRDDHRLANHWANKMIDVAGSEPKKLVTIIADMARSQPHLSSAFVSEFTRSLQGSSLMLPLNWIEQHLAEDGLTIEQLVQEENKIQAANQVTVSNCISSLRLLGDVDWRDFVESMSIVEHTLQKDPAGIYSHMDFETRDCYRHMIERLSRESKRAEVEVALSAIELAKIQIESVDAKNSASDKGRKAHVGFYLIDKGLASLEKALGVHNSFLKKIRRFIGRWALLSYICSILVISTALVYILVTRASGYGINTSWLWLIGAFVALYGSQLGLSVVNLVTTLVVKPRRLPRLDYTKGIPAECRSIVVVPSMLTSLKGVDALVEALEVRFLGNQDPHLQFMLLTDFNDASSQHMPEDEPLLELAEKRIIELNQRYATENNDIFYLCHRPREWNEGEKVWMGKERKRGKLTDLNRLLKENIRSSFSLIVGDTDLLADIKYVITLDSDTQLPRESARQFVGTMSHPLNRPILNVEKNCVMDGYGILQPRMSEALPLEGPTEYVKLCGTEFGVDPYTRAVSDVYQDVFHEGSFMGKGIYDVDLFQHILGQRFPENRILSHDFLEGCYLRSGLVSDIPLYETTPSTYLGDAKRRTRWIRGDWQLLRWLFPKVRNAEGKRVPNPLSLLSKMKLLDNLRRSLVPVALFFLFALSWTILPENVLWLFILLTILVTPLVIKIILELFRKPVDMLPAQHLTTVAQGAKRSLGQLVFYLACLPHEAWYSASAIIRTCWRMAITKRHLLEWAPSDQIDPRLSNTVLGWIINMWACPIAAVGVVLVLASQDRIDSLLYTAPILMLWFVSPVVARSLSKPPKRVEPKLNSEQIRFLHKVSRKTWGFFENFLTVENHWLPPDNYQEAPVEALARRTSPTNMGLSLLANLTAFDFGYINMDQLLVRCDNTLQTMSKMERYRGHFYNWYSTETLELLPPRYISTVDSGNLCAHLLTLRQGFFSLSNQVLLNPDYLEGLKDTVEVLETLVINSIPLKHFKQLLLDARESFQSWNTAGKSADELCMAAEQIASLHEESGISTKEASEWAEKLLAQCHAIRNEINLFTGIHDLSATATLKDIVALNSAIKIHQLAQSRLDKINSLAEQCHSLAQMDFSFLYEESSHLMTIGFNVDEQRHDTSSYDLLASEARLGNFVAIAQGQLPQESWFALGRLLMSSGEEPTLVSWSGSMFEYLMPLLVMPTYSGTLLDQTYCSAVKRQITYGKRRGVPWGVSESGYNAVDAQFNYLYRAFGVPGLGLKRGLEDDLVIAPYATVLALMVLPEAACLNLQRMSAEYVEGRYGFYEAIDFTPSRLPRDSKRVLIRSFMAHHQGMSFLSLSYLLHDKPMQQRFGSDPLFQATLLLLQERIPKLTTSYLQIPKSPEGVTVHPRPETSMRSFKSPNTYTPQVQLLSNGSYHSVITQTGAGYSRWKEFAVTRWREDSTCDDWGLFSYIRDLDTGEYWSTTYQPTTVMPEKFKAVFTEAHAEFNATDKLLNMHSEIVISPEDDIELRRLRIHNLSKVKRTIEFTSYGEIVLAPQAADLTQPAFSNLFVETELLPERRAILATRRSMDGQQSSPWLCHLLNVYGEQEGPLSFETDRARFVGRGRTLANPLVMIEEGNLSNTQGAVLDPIVSIRCRIIIEPHTKLTVDLLTGMADTRENCVHLIEKYQDRQLANRIFGLAWTHGQVLLHHLNVSEENVQLYEKLASAIIYTNNTYRADKQILESNKRGQSSLWAYSISGDLPIVLINIEDSGNMDLVKQLIQAQAYWRHKGLAVDLVVLNQEPMTYRGLMQDQLMSLISGNSNSDHAGNIVACNAEQVTAEDKILLQSVARVILSDKLGSLKEQVNRRLVSPRVMPLLNAQKSAHTNDIKLSPLPDKLQFFNGLGGYSEQGDEYVIRLTDGAQTPAPWCNILANPNFGTLVSESGQGYTWTENAHEFRLTPWENDPIQDSSGEAFYIRDEDTGLVWSPSALPCRGRGDYHIRHGFGYSVFNHVEDGIYSELTMFVAQDAPIKCIILKIRNDSSERRWLSVTGYVAWVLGELRSKNSMYVTTELAHSGGIVAQNHYNTEFGERTCFFDATTPYPGLTGRSVTGDRTEFIGRNGSLNQPGALKRKQLSGRLGGGLDPCGAIQLAFHLAAGQTREIVFTLGAGKDRAQADALMHRFNEVSSAQSALAAVTQFWKKTVNAVQFKTPDHATNLLANGWVLYQVLSSRLWGRTGYYQSSGAFGFRDQLQDVMSLVHVAPDLLRAQILLCAAHQFEAGDVQHWWHPPYNRGVRTRCSDDYLWLPFAICRYIESTGDKSILDEKIAYLQGRPLNAHEESYYEPAVPSNVVESIYQHAVAAIKNGLKFGVHGLPLMGSGDWNDGMNLVGKDGKGESVWLGFFLYSVLKHFAPVATLHGDNDFAIHCDAESKKLQQQLDLYGWDGEWYRRAYFDDGTPLGSASNTECRIDSIAQSWSVLSGAADLKHSTQAMASLYEHLVDKQDNLIKLLEPPFNKSIPNPGYIQGYVPGIRENGGQYTHAAVWAAMAFAQLGDSKLAWQLFRILNPIHHGHTPEEVQRYKIEPYVLAGDVYGIAPHEGRGGWSWYTGSAGWLYRLITETLLGLKLEEGNKLRINPLIPHDWNEFTIEYRHGSSLYQILIQRGAEELILLDNKAVDGPVIPLKDDEQIHQVLLKIKKELTT